MAASLTKFKANEDEGVRGRVDGQMGVSAKDDLFLQK
jgi:hypothetical protein